VGRRPRALAPHPRPTLTLAEHSARAMDRDPQLRHPRWLPRPLRPTPRLLRRARACARETLGERLAEARVIAGWLHPDEAAMLCWLAGHAPPGPIVEIGTFCGKSTVFLASGMRADQTLTAIDPHFFAAGAADAHAPRGAAGCSSWDAYRRTLERWGLTDRVRTVRERSWEVRPRWSEPIALLWIDGDHSPAAVRRDIADWTGCVLPGGYLAFHDTHPAHARRRGWGVREAILESGLLERDFVTLLELRNAWFLRRRGAAV